MKFLYLKGTEIFGPLEAEQLAKEEIFSDDLLVCPEDKAEQEAAWKPASRYENFKVLFEKEKSSIEKESEEDFIQELVQEPKSASEDSVISEPVEIQENNISQDLPPLENTETETDTTEPEEFSFHQVMSEMADKNTEDNQDENEDIKDHTFHIANKDDNLLEDLPAHSLLGPEENLDANVADTLNQKDIAKQNDEIQEIHSFQNNKDFLEISNNKIISSSDGRVKQKRPNDLLFILSFLVITVVAIALCMAFWNMMSDDNNKSKTEQAKTEDIVKPVETAKDMSLVPDVSEQQGTEQKTGKINLESESASLEKQIIDIVKNTELKNKGTIGEYLDKVYGGEYQSSWSAKPFTDNVYIVEFFASQVRSEPFVYLFRVDIDQKKITGALNNITLDLLA